MRIFTISKYSLAYTYTYIYVLSGAINDDFIKNLFTASLADVDSAKHWRMYDPLGEFDTRVLILQLSWCYIWYTLIIHVVSLIYDAIIHSIIDI